MCYKKRVTWMRLLCPFCTPLCRPVRRYSCARHALVQWPVPRWPLLSRGNQQWQCAAMSRGLHVSRWHCHRHAEPMSRRVVQCGRTGGMYTLPRWSVRCNAAADDVVVHRTVSQRLVLPGRVVGVSALSRWAVQPGESCASHVTRAAGPAVFGGSVPCGRREMHAASGTNASRVFELGSVDSDVTVDCC